MVKMQQSSLELADQDIQQHQQGQNQMSTATRSEKTTTFEESYTTNSTTTSKTPLKLVMDPRGQVQNIDTLQRQYELQPMSPDLCAEVVSALNEAGGKGAELFAKRRKKSEKWVIDETNFNNNVNSLQQQKAVTPTAHVANVPPAYTEFGQARAQQNIKLNQIQVRHNLIKSVSCSQSLSYPQQDKYSQPRVKMVKSPWEAALETGYAHEAFEDNHTQQQRMQQQFYQPPAQILSPAPLTSAPPAANVRSQYETPKPLETPASFIKQQQPLSQQYQYNAPQPAYQPAAPAPVQQQPKPIYVPPKPQQQVRNILIICEILFLMQNSITCIVQRRSPRLWVVI